MDIALLRNLAAHIDTKALSGLASWTAGASSDSATFTGTSIDREAMGSGSLALSADFGVIFSATLGSGSTLSILFDVQDSADNTNFSDYKTEATAVVATGPSGGGTVSGLVRMVAPDSNSPAGMPGVDLKGARRYIRLLVVPHLGRTGTDTCVLFEYGVFGGFDFLPAPTT